MDSQVRFTQHPGMAVHAWTLVTILLLAGCAGTSDRGRPAAAAATRTHAEHANAVLFRAIGLVGTPYRYGGNTPEGGFDCSGLVGFVYREATGLALPRSTDEIARMPLPRLPRERLLPGDLVMFGGRGGVDHIGIYVGEGRFVHAPNKGGTVRLDALDAPYWREAWRFGARVLR